MVPGTVETVGVTIAAAAGFGFGFGGPVMPLANEHNASQVRRAAACCSASETFVFFAIGATTSWFPVSAGAGARSLAFNCESMVENNDDGCFLKYAHNTLRKKRDGRKNDNFLFGFSLKQKTEQQRRKSSACTCFKNAPYVLWLVESLARIQWKNKTKELRPMNDCDVDTEFDCLPTHA